jgi:uncharacterized glyoxalase superfamily protein PhnB
MKSTPPGWPRISSSIFYADAVGAIDWLCRAFGFEVRLKVEGEGGRIEHSELVFGEGLIMVGQAGRDDRTERRDMVSPRSIGGANTQVLCVVVDDVDAHCAHARAEGAEIVREPETSDYGPEYWTDRSYGAKDPDGHLWYFMQRLRGPEKPAAP